MRSEKIPKLYKARNISYYSPSFLGSSTRPTTTPTMIIDNIPRLQLLLTRFIHHVGTIRIGCCDIHNSYCSNSNYLSSGSKCQLVKPDLFLSINIIVFVISPQSVNASLDSTAVFYCACHYCTGQLWKVNNNSAYQNGISHRGPDTLSNGTKLYTMSIQTSVEFNESTIQCIIYSPALESSVVKLLVQGNKYNAFASDIPNSFTFNELVYMHDNYFYSCFNQ